MEIIEIVSKLVKPSKPTPPTLCNYNISFFNDIPESVNVPLILYYSTSHKEQKDIQTNIFNHLEISLSKTLTDFYPLAGRYTHHASFIDCRDQGALYIEAKAKFQLSELLGLEQKLKLEMQQDFLPCEVGNGVKTDDPLFNVKVTSFECGGVAIGMCISHKFADMDTFCKFIDNWTTRSREIGNELEFKFEKYSTISSAAHLFPKPDVLANHQLDPTSFEVNNCVMRLFLFKASAIRKLREEVMSDHGNIIRHRPSKVQLIVALLWKAFVDIDRQDGQSKASFVGQAVNLRNIAVSENFYGNFSSFANARIEYNKVINLQVLINLLHDSVNEMKNSYAKALSQFEKDYEVLSKPFLECLENISSKDVNSYLLSSWCRFSFHTADFGWGKPVWKSITNEKIPNSVTMMDDEEGDGVEAWVHLDEKQMCELEKDSNLQAYMDA
ncbi:hypothetical protein L1987_55251 [Smallanthus sonchifolius]|uniref:Uncharacterized protein n=1 Tax=Smallanthus sonchifolius TaxID=185202 RepID=A0ACB9E9T5_9ASTR|nr:hypothetical protein L1987_55251 [Smallanthus sonchifolius]